MYIPISSSLRFIEPKVEIYAQDRRSGAYPTKARTGDRTRSGKNAYYFDDTRTVLFATGVSVSLPTTFQTRSVHLATDMSSSQFAVGNVIAENVDQWIPHRAQEESPGPFNESYLYEQTEVGVVNSTFMTGCAYTIAPERFKSSLANKTVVRLEIPLRAQSQLTPSSSLHYLNPVSGGFIKVVNHEPSLTTNGGSYPTTFAPIPFTPYGMHYLPLNDSAAYGFNAAVGSISAQVAYQKITSYQGDGTDADFYGTGGTTSNKPVTASVLNPLHRASVSQSIRLSDYLSHPFLLEKAVVEFPFAAGPGWLNDRFGIREAMQDDLTYTIDAGGPMITFALMRQDKSDTFARDIIASGTITNALDMTTGSYAVCSAAYVGLGGYTDVMFTPEGLGWFANPTAVITGSVLSGSTNTYTGSVKMILEPAVTSHVWRLRTSGSCVFYYNVGTATSNDRATRADGIGFGPITRRSVKHMSSGRSILGNHFALIDADTLDGTQNPVKVMDTQNESLAQDSVAPRFYKAKIYHDVISATAKSPYLLYPEDDLILCLSKHRAVGSQNFSDWDNSGERPQPNRLVAFHDVQIPTGTLKITLYGNLIKEDREFHDTLNQRLETVELYETVGEEPVIDQFDVTFAHELSASYLDRFRVYNALANTNYGPKYMLSSDKMGTSTLTSSFALHSNFATTVPRSGILSTEHNWSQQMLVHEIKKSTRNAICIEEGERLWDTRLIEPLDAFTFMAGTSLFTGSYNSFFVAAPSVAVSNVQGSWGNGGDSTIKDWYMTYPYEAKFNALTYVFSDELQNRVTLKPEGQLPRSMFYEDIILHMNGSDSSLAQNSSKIIVGQPISPAKGAGLRNFIIGLYGTGHGRGPTDNKHVTYRSRADGGWATTGPYQYGSPLYRGWRYGLANAFVTKPISVWRRDRYGQFRDMLEQRLFTKMYAVDAEIPGVKEGPVQVRFYDRDGNITESTLTLSSNLSFEATSSFPYTDGIARNREELDFSRLNITSVDF